MNDELKSCLTKGCPGKVGVESLCTAAPNYRVGCILCGEAYTDRFKTKQKAIEAWSKQNGRYGV